MTTWLSALVLVVGFALWANSAIGCGRAEVDAVWRVGALTAFKPRLTKWGWCWRRLRPEHVRSSIGRQPIVWREDAHHGSRLDGAHDLPVGLFLAPRDGGRAVFEADHLRFGVLPTRTRLGTFEIPPAE